ncbi:TIGR00266 family protein [Candidatus Altiarchaeales archaeon WOR_SM1_SCG]|nr:TIGR00266 family protein [Candidatus Altiarchaeales archaeon WOR_SM1_SCG]
MKYKIRGTTLQVVDIELEKGESVYTESGGMSWMSPNLDMETNTKGGILSGIGRKFAGESLFMTTYTCSEGTGSITFVNEFPGKIIPLKLGEGETIIAQKDAFMCAESSVNLSVYFRKKLGAGLFGGEGFILQKLTGPGMVFIELAGEVTEYKLESGQVLKVDPGHIGLFEPTVDYDISRVKGIKNILFSGEGLFLATLKGPGSVWLQSMPISNLAAKVAKYVPKG